MSFSDTAGQEWFTTDIESQEEDWVSKLNMESQEEDWVPKLNMEFETIEEAWLFWNKYSGKMGFSARNDYSHKSKKDGVVTMKVFVCSNAGERKKDKRDDLTKKPRAETRTGCLVRLQVKFNRGTQRYEVVHFVSEHNHPLQKPEASYLLRSQRDVSQVACYDIVLADDSGIRPKEAHELMGRQVGGSTNLGHTIVDHRNYLRDKRKRALVSGEAVAMMNYFHERVMENPSFQHFEDTDKNQEITNIFWADGKMIGDYARFGDVVIFDTTFGTNKSYMPFGVFVGLNHFREIVVFGATLMHDQTTESFEWVFQSFFKAHNGKKPKTIFTDQDKAMGNAIENVMPEVTHGLCCWHINENSFKYLKDDNRKAFSACMYEYEQEYEFDKAFSDLKGMTQTNWLTFIYAYKKKWAYCFMKNAVTLGIRSTQLGESINSDLKDYLNSNMDVIQFFHHFERVLAGKREKEIVSEFDMTSKKPKTKMKIPILEQASSLYTPKFFALFQDEYELAMSATIQGILINEYTVTMCEFGGGDINLSSMSHKVVWNRDDETALCTCKKFEREGILCWHVLKVLDMENIKKIPQHYVLKRWTKEAKNETIVDRNGTIVVEDTTLDMTRRNRDMNREFAMVRTVADKHEEATKFVIGALQTIRKQVVANFQIPSTTTNDCGKLISTPIFIDNLCGSTPKMKKKEGKKGTRRTRSCNEKVRNKYMKKTMKVSTSQATEGMRDKEHHFSQDPSNEPSLELFLGHFGSN